MTKSSSDAPIIDRTRGSEERDPELTIAATPVGNESLYVGKIESTEGKTAFIRVARTGYRCLLENKYGSFTPAPPVYNHAGGVHLSTANVGRLGDLREKLKALDFELTDESVVFLEQLPECASAAYTVAREQRAVVPADYLPAALQQLREYSQGASPFRGY